MPRGGKRPGAGRPRKNPQNASFEAAQPTYDRPSVWLWSVDAKREATAWDRQQLMKQGRWVVNNSGIGSRIVRGVARFAVGNGLVPQARTSDAVFNEMAERFFEDRYCNTPFAFDKAATFDFYTAQTALIESMLTDGDVFCQLSASESGNPMVRFVGAEHCFDGNYQDASWIDGVLVNRDSRPVAYRFYPDPTVMAAGDFVDVPAEDVIHIKRAHRIGYVRGISWLGSAVDRIQDLRDYVNNELSAAKLNSKVAFVIKSEEAGGVGMGAALRKVSASDGTAEYKLDSLVPGVGSVQLKPGESLDAHQFERPNANMPQFVDHLCREIAYSVGVSPEIIWSIAGLGGTATRQALIDAEVFFGGIRLIIENKFCNRFWRYAIWRAIESGELPYPGDNWFRAEWIPPQRLTVDNGRDGKLRLELYRAGLLSARRYHNELGQDEDKELEDIVRGAARRKKLVERISEEEGVELSMQEVFPPAPGQAAVPVEDDSEDDDMEEDDSEDDMEQESK